MSNQTDNNSSNQWSRFQKHFLRYTEIGISLDISRMTFDEGFFGNLEPKIDAAFSAMDDLENGAIANPDEDRMVGHYWLRAPQLAPDDDLRKEITEPRQDVRAFAEKIHRGEIRTKNGERFTEVLLIGIGGSALGPQFIADALGAESDKMTMHYLDNTDPDGIDRTLRNLSDRLDQTLSVVISKSGGTPETRNGMLEARHAYEQAGLVFAEHAVAITGPGSKLDKQAENDGWLARFPMSDWVGGRTSVMSAVGLLPMELQGLDTESFLAGAAAMDELTRQHDLSRNAAMLLAAMWYYAGDGAGKKDMVVLPYKDRLVLFSKYLQQLIMESIGKEQDLDGNTVNQGIAVYGNKGSTDQHAYVQQLREGINNFFVTFIEVRQDRVGTSIDVGDGATSGDYLQGFLRGTRAALSENGRESLTLSIPEVTAFHVGCLIALFERAVGFYASLINVNAYHQPGVEAGKKAAGKLLELQQKVLEFLKSKAGNGELSAPQVAEGVDADPEDVYHTLVHLAVNHPQIAASLGTDPASDSFKFAG